MADQTLMDFFSGPVMTELAQSESIKRGLPYFLPEELRKPSVEKPVGTQIKYKSYKGNRATAQLVHQASTSREVEVAGSHWEYATAIGSREHFVVDQDFLYALKSGVPYVAEQAKREYVKRVADFQNRMDNLRIGAVASTFGLGRIYADSNGNLLPTSGGNVLPAPDSNSSVQTFTKTSNYPNIPTTAVGDWSSAGTDIPGSLRALQESFLRTSNFTASTSLYGRSIPSYLYGNTAMQTFLSRQPMLNQEFMDTNEVPKGLLDFNWHPAYKNYFVDSTGTVQSWFADNQITVIAEVSDLWYEFYEAGTLIPKGIAGPGQDIEQFLGNIEVANGKFGYAEMSTNPIKIKAISGDYFLPLIKNGLVVWILTVS